MELEFKVVVNPSLQRRGFGERPDEDPPDEIAFGDFAGSDVYFGGGLEQQGLTDFFEHLLLGSPLPLTLVMRRVESVGMVVGTALFLHRDLALQNTTAGLVYAANLVDRYGDSGLAHVDRDVAGLIDRIREYFPPDLSMAEGGQRLQDAVQWVRRYILEGALPPDDPCPVPRVLDVGTNGFVVAELSFRSERQVAAAWVELYRLGYLQGVLFGIGAGVDRARVCVAKKSHYLELDLRKAREVLNEAEAAMGELPEWVLAQKGPQAGLVLRSPEEGTLIPPVRILDVLVRC